MMRRWQQWEPRQQLTVLGLGALGAVVLLGVVLTTLHGKEAEARNHLQRARQELAQVEALAGRLQVRRNRGAGNTDLLAILSASLQQAGLQATRMQQDSPDEVQLRFEGIPYAAAIAWLAQLEQQGELQLARVTLSAGNQGSASLGLTVRKQ